MNRSTPKHYSKKFKQRVVEEAAESLPPALLGEFGAQVAPGDGDGVPVALARVEQAEAVVVLDQEDQVLLAGKDIELVDAGGGLCGFMAGAADLEVDLVLSLQQDLAMVDGPGGLHEPVGPDEFLLREPAVLELGIKLSAGRCCH